MDYVRLGFKRWLDIAGRSSRIEYIAFTGMFILLFTLLLIIGTIFGETAGAIIAIPTLLVVLIACIPQFTLTIRRLHDINLPGFLVVIAYLIPFLNIIMVIALAVVPGSAGNNKYGGDAGVPSDYLGKI